MVVFVHGLDVHLPNVEGRVVGVDEVQLVVVGLKVVLLVDLLQVLALVARDVRRPLLLLRAHLVLALVKQEVLVLGRRSVRLR